jgi:hypothetical protein
MERNELSRYKEAWKANEKARAMRIFLSHFAAFVLGNVFFGVWNVLTYFLREDSTLWFYLPLIFWGVGVLIHYLQAVALFENWWERDERVITERLGGA